MNEENKQDSATEDSINKRLSNMENTLTRIEEYHKDEGVVSQHNQLQQFKLAIDQFNFALKEAEVNIFTNLAFSAMWIASIGLAIASMGIAKNDSFLETLGWTGIIVAACIIPAYYLTLYFRKIITKK
jgi:hypothetical protein